MPTWRRELDDDLTGPVLIPVDVPHRSVADQVVAALASTPSHRAQREPSLRLFRVLLIVLFAGVVAASVAFAFHPGGPVLGAHDRTLVTHSGDCLNWPDGVPDQAAVVDCAGDHLFEVAEPVDIDGFSDEPGLGTDRQLEQAFKQDCPAAASRYLDGRLDPGGRFVVGMLWSPSGPQPLSGGRLVCGLQLRSDGSASKPFRGRIADQDQSNVWPSGTCLGIENGQSTDLPVDCGTPHAMEVVGTANLADTFPGPWPSVGAQDATVRDVCNTKAVDYLAPRPLTETTLSLHYTPISSTGWAAGSRWIACRLASMKPDGSWATLVGSARTEVLVDGVAPAPVVEPAAVVPSETIVNAGGTAVPDATPPAAEASPVPAEVGVPGDPPTEPPAEGPLPGPLQDQPAG